MPNKGRATLQLGSAASLQKRLAENRLTHNDEKARARALAIYELREQGLPQREIAERLGETLAQVNTFVRGGVYPIFVAAHKVAQARESVDAAAVKEMAEQLNDSRFDAMAPLALDFLESAFERDEEGAWTDKGLAQWATERVAKRKGWDEAPHAARPVIEIHVDTIQVNSQAIRASDAARVIDVTPAPAADAAAPALPPAAPAAVPALPLP